MRFKRCFSFMLISYTLTLKKRLSHEAKAVYDNI